MKKRVAIFLIVVLFLIGVVLFGIAIGGWSRTEETGSAQVVEALKEKIQGRKEPQEIFKAIVSLLGEPDRDIGSGLWIPQWDMPGGVLTFHPFTGPIFQDETGKVTWLLNTTNELGANIVGNYEMTTVPDLDNYGNSYWLGNLELRTDGTYEYTDSNVNLEHRQHQQDNFFIKNPKGTYAIAYLAGLTGMTLLEDLESNTYVATLEFRAERKQGEANSGESFLVWIDTETRVLYLSATVSKIETYRLEKSWDNFWD